jgi:hypothetical protein
MAVEIYQAVAAEGSEFTPNHPGFNSSVPAGGFSYTSTAGGEVVSNEKGNNAVDGYALNANLGTILSTAENNGTAALHGKIGPDTTIRVEGMALTVREAEMLGFLTQDPQTGKYRETGLTMAQAAQQSQRPQQHIPQASQGERLPPAVEATVQALSSRLPETAMTAVIQSLAAGEMPSSLHDLAYSMGVDSGLLAGQLNSVRAAYTSQAAASIARVGIDDPQAFYSWAQEKHPERLRSAVNGHIYGKTTAGYVDLARDFAKADAMGDEEALLTSELGNGMKAVRINGRVILNVPGFGQMDAKTAIREGIVRVSR